MQPIAEASGFAGSAAEWAQEYVLLCNDYGIDSAVGIDFPRLRQLVDDDSDNGCYCLDYELQTIINVARSRRKCPAENVAAADYVVGSPIEVYSQSYQGWIQATIEEVTEAGMVTASFLYPDEPANKFYEKSLPAGHPDMRLPSFRPRAQISI